MRGLLTNRSRRAADQNTLGLLSPRVQSSWQMSSMNFSCVSLRGKRGINTQPALDHFCPSPSEDVGAQMYAPLVLVDVASLAQGVFGGALVLFFVTPDLDTCLAAEQDLMKDTHGCI